MLSTFWFQLPTCTSTAREIAAALAQLEASGVRREEVQVEHITLTPHVEHVTLTPHVEHITFTPRVETTLVFSSTV